MCVCVNTEIASAADEFQKSLLMADADCIYDSIVEINLDTVCLCSTSLTVCPDCSVWSSYTGTNLMVLVVTCHECVTVLHCCKGDTASQWEMAILVVSELCNP